MSDERIYGVRVLVTGKGQLWHASTCGLLAHGRTKQQALERIKERMDQGDRELADIRNQHAALQRVRGVVENLKETAQVHRSIADSEGEPQLSRSICARAAVEAESIVAELEAALEGSDS